MAIKTEMSFMPEYSVIRDNANSIGKLYFEADIATPGLMMIPVVTMRLC